MNPQQLDKITQGQGFIAALDQSGGSTPKALRLYGMNEDAYSGEAQMFDLVHAMRERIVTNAAFNGARILGAILFEMTMERSFAGLPAAQYLWQEKQVVPFLKVDKGLVAEANGVQLMQPIPALAALLARAKDVGIFGTKMRSVIHAANADGIAQVVAQQFAVGQEIVAARLMPIIEPEVHIAAPDKAEAEALLKAALLQQLDGLPEGQQVMLKLTLPSSPGFYAELVQHPRVLRVVALSGGYTREQANALLAENPGVIASFSRALTEGLTAQQSDTEFHTVLDAAIASIYQASIT